MKKKQKKLIGHIRLLGLAALMTTSLTLQAQNSFISQGHTDIDIGYEDSTFSLGLTFGEPEQDFDVNNTALVVLAAAHTTVPNNTNFSFLGSPGSDVWILPQVQNTNLLFLGFGAEGINPGTFRGNQLTMTLKSVSGPGKFSVYLTDGFGTPTKWFSSDDAPGTDIQTIPTGAHTHVNWAFSEQGDYEVTLQGDAFLPDNTPVSTGPVTYLFHVIGVPTTYLTKGHTDIDIGYDDDTFELGISHGEPEQDFDVNNTVLVALAGAHTTVPANTNFSFLGSPGSDVWILPQVQNTNLLFLGFGAEDIDSGTFASNQLTLTLKYAAGPGNFFVYWNDGFGTPTEWFSSEDAPGTDARIIPTGAHTHVNWAFSAPGDYTVVLQADASLPDLTPVTTGNVYYSFHVVGTNENWINPTAPQLQVAAAGNTLDLSWPDHQGWILQSNSVSLTASNSWSPYPADGSTNVEGVAIQMNPGKPNVFFRMVKP
jgi:surface-anchored protein